MGSKLIKKIIIVLLFVSSAFSNAQNNGGFENWITVGTGTNTYQEPVGWQTLNFLKSFGNPLSAFKATGTDINSGNYALKIKSVYLPYKPLPQLPDTMGLVFNGKITIAPPSYQIGSVYNSRPSKLTLYAKFIPVISTDFAYAGAVVYRQLASGRDTIGAGQIKIYSSGAYSYYEVNIIYRSNAVPDSANIYFQASSQPTSKRVGNELFIDDVAFDGFVNVNEYETNASYIKLYPNPSSNLITINAQLNEAEKVEVTTITGGLINSYTIQNFNAIINTEHYKCGTYLYKILNKKNEILTNGKFIISN